MQKEPRVWRERKKKERKAGGPPVRITNCRRRGAITNRSCRSLYSPQSLTRYEKNKKKRKSSFYLFFIFILWAQTTIELLERSMILTRWTRIGTRVCVYTWPPPDTHVNLFPVTWSGGLTKNSVVGASSSVYRYQISRANWRRDTLTSICRIPKNRIDCSR